MISEPGRPRRRVLLLDTKRSNPNHYICLAIEHALRKHPEVELVAKVDLHNAISVGIEKQCDLFFAFDGEELDVGVCTRLAALCGASVLWVTEDPYEIAINVRNSELFDLVFTNDSASVPAYGGKGRHLPLAGALPFHFLKLKTEAADFRYDLFFAGTAWPNRVSLLKELLQNDWRDAKFRTKIALPTNEHLPPVDLPLPPSQLNWRTSPVDFAKFANMSLATLVLPRIFSAAGPSDFAETPPPRLFEAALAGTVQLVQSNLVEARQYFEPEREFIYFDGAADLIERLQQLRQEPALRQEIASRAQARALEHHCYEHRIARVFEELARLAPAARPTRPVHERAAKARLLFVVHNTAARGHFGGVEVYLQHLAVEMRSDYEVLFWVPNEQGDAAGALLMNEHARVLKAYEFSVPASPWQLTCSEREAAFGDVLTAFDIEFVHFHHLLQHVPSLVEIAKALGVPTAMTFHDFYALCHNFTLLAFNGSYCEPDKISTAQCDVCLWNGHHVIPGGQSARRAFWDRVIEATDLLIFNTSGGQELAAKIYPAVRAHRRVEILPVPAQTGGPAIERQHPARGEPLRIAMMGNFARHKGSDVVARVMPLLAQSNIEFHIFGRLEEGYAWLADQSQFPFVHAYGGYAPGSIPPALLQCHVSLHLSIWPETYCLTLSEAWDCGLVPIVADIGALGERVTDGVNGLKIPPQSEGALVQAIHALIETPGLLARLRSGVVGAPIARMADHSSRLRAVYGALIDSHERSQTKVAVPMLTYAQLSRPLMNSRWAIVPSSPSPMMPSHIPGLRARLSSLLRRTSNYYRRNGMASTVMASARYVRRRL